MKAEMNKQYIGYSVIVMIPRKLDRVSSPLYIAYDICYCASCLNFVYCLLS